jgi:hypothetical protein
MQARYSQEITQTEKEGYGKVHDDIGPYESPLGSRIGIHGQGRE